MRNGDFSQLLGGVQNITHTGNANCAGAAGTVVTLTNRDGSPALPGQIYNPLTGQSITRCNPVTGTVQTAVERLPFVGNILSAGFIYSPTQAFLRLFPEPNLPGIVSNFITDQNSIRPYRSYLGKIDHNFNGNNRISGKFYHSRNTEILP